MQVFLSIQCFLTTTSLDISIETRVIHKVIPMNKNITSENNVNIYIVVIKFIE